MIGRPSANTPASSSIRGTRRRARVAPRTSPASKRLLLAAVLASLRPRQWVKNLFVFAGLIFSQKLFTPLAGVALAPFAVFCALSGAVYLLNDVADRETDRFPPRKRERPIAAGRLPARMAVAAALVLVAAGLAASIAISPRLALVSLAYVTLMGAYSAWLKHLVIVDVIVVAAGFLLRRRGRALALRGECSC